MRGSRQIHGRWPVWSWVGVAAVCAAASGCAGPPAGSDVRPRASVTSTSSEPNLSDTDLWLSFDDDAVGYDGSTEYPDAMGGPFAGRVVIANGGTVETVQGVGGADKAVGFPARCSEPRGCPRAMVEVLPSPALNPGEDDFAYGASVWLAPDQTTTGSNIVQKGRFSTTGGLWKLQVDSDKGQPSCVVRSGEDLLTVRSSVSIADSSWHRVECRRDETGISIRVDDTVERVDGSTGSVDNEWPIRIGSPGVGDQDDQFHGRVDDVFLRIAPST